jgi:NAD(P)-dependent dehydrogenase (short-subunit alcohol dehydrogenase family)
MKQPTFDFSDQVAVVTGASSGMGAVTARRFAEAGAAVVLADVNEAALEHVAHELTDAGHTAIAVRCDVADEAQTAAMVQAGVEAFGRIDVAFNNAGIQAPYTDTADQKAEDFDRLVAVNLSGHLDGDEA